MNKLCGKEKFLIEETYTEEEQEQYGLPQTLHRGKLCRLPTSATAFP